MDTETVEVIAGLRGDIQQVDGRLTKVEVHLSTRIDHVEARLTTRIDRLDESVERLFEETRRHFDVITESLRDDIRMLAEGLVALSVKVDRFLR